MATASGGVCERLTTRRSRRPTEAGREGGTAVVITRPRAGRLTAVATGIPPTTRATWTAQSDRPGSPNSRVNDPDAWRLDARRVVGPLLGEHRVIRTEPGQRRREQEVGEAVTLVAQLRRGEIAGACSQGHQGLTGLTGEEACQLVVRDRGFFERSEVGLLSAAPRRTTPARVPHLGTPAHTGRSPHRGPAHCGRIVTTSNDILLRPPPHPPK